MLNPLIRLLGGVACLGALAGTALAAPLTAQEIATYQGADRTERLIEGAKKEGSELAVYHAYPQLASVTAAFAKKYDIKVTAWRSGSENILQRIGTEARANKFAVDIVQNNAPEQEAAHRERLLQPVASAHLKDLVPGAVPAHKDWVGITLDVYSAAYNTTKVKKEELPKTYRELLDPKWKGRLAMEAEDQAWYAVLGETLGDPKLLNDIVATNNVSVRKGHSLLASLVASGEVPLALSVYSWNPAQLKAKGAPIEGHLIQPVVAQFSTVAMLKNAPHPNTAALFYDFVLNEGQQILAQMHFVPTTKKLASPLGDVPLKLIDPGRALDLQDKWTKAYQAATRR
jgi:iron(III) transport system substrate-binding protein